MWTTGDSTIVLFLTRVIGALGFVLKLMRELLVEDGLAWDDGAGAPYRRSSYIAVPASSWVELSPP